MAAEISGDHSRNAKAEMVRTVTASIYLTERNINAGNSNTNAVCKNSELKMQEEEITIEVLQCQCASP